MVRLQIQFVSDAHLFKILKAHKPLQPCTIMLTKLACAFPVLA